MQPTETAGFEFTRFNFRKRSITNPTQCCGNVSAAETWRYIYEKEILMKNLPIILLLLLQSFILYGKTEFISPDGKKRVVINRTPDKRYQVIVNSSSHKRYRKIVKNKIYFFTDSSRVAYIAKCDDGYCVVVDGIEQPHVKKIINDKLTFSPDRSHCAYMVLKDRGLSTTKTYYVIDGEEHPMYDDLSSAGITFSLDSKHWAYAALNDNEWFYIIDGEEQPHYKNVLTKIIFSKNCIHWAYGAFNNDEWICVSNENESPYDTINICNEYLLSTTFPKKEEPTDLYISVGPCINTIGGDFDGKTYYAREARSIGLYYGSCFIPEIKSSYGYMFKLGGLVKYDDNKRYGFEICSIRSYHNASWEHYDMEVKYSAIIFTFKFVYLIKEKIMSNFNISYPIDKLEIKNSEWTVSENYEIEIIGDNTLYNSKWNPIPLNIGGSLDFVLNKYTVLNASIDYQIKSNYREKGYYPKFYYDNSGNEIEREGGFSSQLLNISAGISFYLSM